MSNVAAFARPTSQSLPNYTMSKLSYGLNITKKAPSLAGRPPPAKRKTIFDDDSGPEDGSDDEDNAEAITTIGGLTPSSKPNVPKSTKPSNGNPLNKPPKHRIPQIGDLSTNHSTFKHAQAAQEVDPSIYDYDSIYDSLHAAPPPKDPTAPVEGKRPKYMSNLLAAAEVRKRDQLRAKEKMLAKEREAEGDEFADKEKFVTAAYKRQQAEMAKLEEEEVAREKEAEERKRREGGGMKGLYKEILERGEKRHEAVVKAVEEGRGKEGVGVEKGAEGKKGKTEEELAREKGAIVNEDGQVVDKRQLLTAGLNAGSAPKSTVSTKRPPDAPSEGSSRAHVPTGREGRKESARERETRLFEEQLLGKRGADDEADGEAERAAKSRKLEEEILGLGR